MEVYNMRVYKIKTELDMIVLNIIKPIAISNKK